MLTHEQNELLTRVEGDAPMGRLMREHYWIPALLSAQLEADGAPQRVRLLGEDHVAFRASDGRVGFFAEACPHRGCSLVLARNEECGLRCIFHGWKIDVGGFVSDVPTHAPNPEAFAAKVPVEHHPVHEGGGIVWVWLGATPAPPFPELPFTALDDRQVWMTITKAYCNWLQGVEATLDSAHVGTLHEAYITRWADTGDKPLANTLEALAPRYDVEHTNYGLDAIALRPLPDGSTYLRTTTWIAPFVSIVPGSGGPHVVFIASPIDDTHHNLFYGSFSDEEIHDGVHQPGFMDTITGDRPYDPFNFGGFTGSRDDNYGQDRDAMTTRSLQRLHRQPPAGGHGHPGEHGPDRRPHEGAPLDRRRRRHPGAPAAPAGARRHGGRPSRGRFRSRPGSPRRGAGRRDPAGAHLSSAP